MRLSQKSDNSKIPDCRKTSILGSVLETDIAVFSKGYRNKSGNCLTLLRQPLNIDQHLNR